MSKLIDLALTDSSENFSQTSSAQYQVKHYLDKTLRQLQEECVNLNNVISMLNKETDVKALEKLNAAVEVNRSRYGETVKIAAQMDIAINSLTRGQRWLSAISDELKS